MEASHKEIAMNLIAPVVLSLQLSPVIAPTAVQPKAYLPGPSVPAIIAIQPVRLPSPVIVGELYKLPARLAPTQKELPAPTAALPKALPGRGEDQFKRLLDQLFDGKKAEKTPPPVTLPESDLEREIGVVYEP